MYCSCWEHVKYHSPSYPIYCSVLSCPVLLITLYYYVCVMYVSDELLREDSEVKKIFGGQLRSQLVCPDCAKVTVYFEYHRSVSHLTLLYFSLLISVWNQIDYHCRVVDAKRNILIFILANWSFSSLRFVGCTIMITPYKYEPVLFAIFLLSSHLILSLYLFSPLLSSSHFVSPLLVSSLIFQSFRFSSLIL